MVSLPPAAVWLQTFMESDPPTKADMGRRAAVHRSRAGTGLKVAGGAGGGVEKAGYFREVLRRAASRGALEGAASSEHGDANYFLAFVGLREVFRRELLTEVA